MKKGFIALLVVLTILSSFSFNVCAKNGDVIGEALNTDIVAYINHFAIPCVVVNDRACVVAEDLSNFGFDVKWNSQNRSLSISRNPYKKTVTPIDVTKLAACGTKCCDILETDIKVFAAGQEITSYSFDGYTLIPLEELSMFGNMVWNQEYRFLKFWIEDGLQMRATPQETIDTLAEFHELLEGVWVDPATYRKDIPDIDVYDFNAIFDGYDMPGTHYGHLYRSGYILSAQESGRNKYSMVLYYPEEVYFDEYYAEGYYDVGLFIGRDTGRYIAFDYEDYATKWYYMGTDYEEAGRATKEFVRKDSRY